MGDEGISVALNAEDVRDHADAIATACAGSLTTVLGTDFTASMRAIDAADNSCAVEADGPVVHALGRAENGDAAYSLHLIAPRDEAAVLAGLQLGEDASEIEEATKEELSADRRAAFQGVAKALLGSLQTTLGAALPGEIAMQDAREIAQPKGDPTWLDAGDYVRLQLGVDCELIEQGVLTLLVPGDGHKPMAPVSGLVFLEHSPEECERLEVLGGELDCEVSVEEPADFLEQLDEEEEEFDRVLVVPWDMGGRSGLEFLEALRRDERLAGVRIVIASDAPTRGQVLAAMRAGAFSFLRRPYERAEIESRLLGGNRKRGGNEAAVDGEGGAEASEDAGSEEEADG